jgi:8-oxo-dGTP diphosphatase
MNDRSRVVLVQGDEVALMRRERMGATYYVFPGGGIEAGETPEQAAVREAHEELGVDVALERLLVTDEFHGVHSYFYRAHLAGGRFGTGKGPEYRPGNPRGTYTPVWVSRLDLIKLDVRPRSVANLVLTLPTQGDETLSVLEHG